SLPALLSNLGIGETSARMLVASLLSGALIIFAFAHTPFQRAWGQITAGIAVGVLVTAGWFVTGYLGAGEFHSAGVSPVPFVALGGILLGTAAGLRGVLRVQPLLKAHDATRIEAKDGQAR